MHANALLVAQSGLSGVELALVSTTTVLLLLLLAFVVLAPVYGRRL